MWTYLAALVSIHDADTLTVDVNLGFDLTIRQTVRLAHLDAPELSTDAGKAAKQYLVDLLPTRLVVTTIQTKAGSTAREKYGRLLAVISFDGLAGPINANQALIDSGHAREWEGRGPKPW